MKQAIRDAITAALLWLLRKVNTRKDEHLAMTLVDLAKDYARRPDDIRSTRGGSDG